MNGGDGAAIQLSDVGGLAVGTLVGSLVGIITAVVLLTVLRVAGRQSPLAVRTFRRIRAAATISFLLLGSWIGYVLNAPVDEPDWYAHIKHFLLILVIISAGWLAYAALGMLQDAALLTDVKTGRDARRFRTQAAMLRRTLQALTIFLTVVFVLLTFPEARAPMTSLLASAGLISVVIGIAAQSTLGNMLAGLQLAFSDALRVGDIVVVAGETQPSTVEELTLTYIVVRTWDERRLLVPSSQLTTQSFENWTRRASKLLGSIDLTLDWAAPVAEIRAEVERLLFATPNWDKRTWTVQVSALDGPYITLRIIASAKDWPRLYDLRAYLRENVLAWVETNAPWAIPRQRYIDEPIASGESEWPTDAILPEHLAAPTFTGPLGGGYMRAEQQQILKQKLPADATPATPSEDVDEGKNGHVGPLAKFVQKAVGPAAATGVQDRDRLPGREDPYDHPVPEHFKQLGKGDMLFSGTPDGEERGRRYSGPGAHIIEQREKRAARREAEANAPLPPDIAQGDQAVPLPQPSAHNGDSGAESGRES